MPPSDSSKKTQNSGYLYPNEKKNDNQPDKRGKLNINGKEWWISAWEKKDRNGVDFLSLAVTDPADQSRSLSQKGVVPAKEAKPFPLKQESNQNDSSLPHVSAAPASEATPAPAIHSVDDTFGDIFKDM